jgi:hypothetical protein
VHVEDARCIIKSEYTATADPAAQLALLDRAEPVIRRRMAMLDRKLGLVAALHAEDQAILERISALRDKQLNEVVLVNASV